MKNIRNQILGRAAHSAEAGMTLIEIMVVIAIISILATAISYSVFSYFSKAKVGAAKAQLDTVAQAVDMYYLQESDCPESLAKLAEGADAPLKAKNLKDPWKEDLLYACPSQKGQGRYDICSKGPDKKEGTEDDICND